MPVQESNWQPISALPVVSSMIDGMIGDSQEQYQTLLEGKLRPHTLDGFTVNRVLKVFDEQAQYLAHYEEQLGRWKGLALTPNQQSDVERLAGKLNRAQAVNQNILVLAKQLKEGTLAGGRKE